MSEDLQGVAPGPQQRVLLMYWGSTGAGPRFALELLTALQASTNIQATASISRQSQLRSNFAATAERLHEVDTVVPGPAKFLDIRRWVRNARNIRRIVRANSIDSVVVPMEAPWDIIAMAVARRPVTLVLHDVDLHPGMRSPLERLSHRLHIALAARIVVLSANAHSAALRMGLAEKPGGLVQAQHPPFRPIGWVDTGQTRSLPTGRPMVIGFFGRIVAYKGLDLFIEMAECLQGSVEFAFKIVGSGTVPQDQRDRIVAAGIELQNGYVEEHQLLPTLQDFDLLVLPYREASQSGVVGLAATIGLPIVATNVEGLKQQVLEVGGILADLSGEDLAQKAQWLMADPQLYADVSRRAQSGSRSAYSWVQLANDVVPK